jgi:plastocyanin
VIFTAAFLLLAACGNDDGGDVRESGSSSGSESGSEASGSTSGEEPPVSLEGEVNDHGSADVQNDEIEVELDDFYFGPTFVKGTPGETVTVDLTNEGDAAHTFTSDALGADEEVAPGDSSSVTVTLPADGAVEFHCRFHEGQGMKGAFFFNPGDQVTSGQEPAEQ